MSSVRLFEATNARVKKSAAMVDEIFCREYKGSSYDNRSVDDFYATLRSDKTSLSDLADVQDTLQQYHQRISASVKGNKQMIDTFKVTDRESEKLMAFTKELYATECKFMQTYQIMASKLDAIKQEKLSQQVEEKVASLKI